MEISPWGCLSSTETFSFTFCLAWFWITIIHDGRRNDKYHLFSPPPHAPTPLMFFLPLLFTSSRFGAMILPSGFEAGTAVDCSLCITRIFIPE
jgi:hypothetical protein